MEAVRESGAPGAAERRAAVVRAIGAMRAGLARPQPLAALARSALFSPFYFHRIFHQITGLTPARFLAALRMAEARRLLLQTGIPVRRIAEQVGYASPGTFCTQFSRMAGLSPARFRVFVQGLGFVEGRSAERGDDRLPAGPIMALSRVPVTGSLVLGRISSTGDQSAEPGKWLVWTLEAGSDIRLVRLPPAPQPGDYAVLTVAVPLGVRLADALVDRPGSYLLGRAQMSLTGRDQPTVRVHTALRWPESTDPPKLAITPIGRLLPAVA